MEKQAKFILKRKGKPRIKDITNKVNPEINPFLMNFLVSIK